MPACLVVQHVEPEGPYAIGEALAAEHVDVDCRAVHRGDALPDELAGFDGLVVMGGPMSATSDDGYPTRRREIALLEEALRRGLPTLGVCLGAQLLACAAGGEVRPGSAGPEIGWAPVTLTGAAVADPLVADAPSVLTVLHWHGDTYSLPPGAVRLATSAAYPQQAFRLGKRAWGIQFHLEVDAGAVGAFVDAFGDDARQAGTTAAAITAATPAALAALRPVRQVILGRFAAMVAGGPGDATAAATGGGAERG